MYTEQQLLDLKKQVETAKTQVSELTGQQNAIIKQFRDDWQCKDISAADDKLKAIQLDVALIDQQIEQKSAELQQKYQG
jgi:DNA-binding FrmR family transcriptional regulator